MFSSGVITSSGALFCRPHMQQSYMHRMIFLLIAVEGGGGGISGNKALFEAGWVERKAPLFVG